jgi:hypothetical protein
MIFSSVEAAAPEDCWSVPGWRRSDSVAGRHISQT